LLCNLTGKGIIAIKESDGFFVAILKKGMINTVSLGLHTHSDNIMGFNFSTPIFFFD